MSDRKDGGPAFPHVSRWCHQFTDEGVLIGCFPSGGGGGMTLHDWFAGQAFTGMLAATPHDKIEPAYLARLSYLLAGAMLEAREGKS